LNWRSSGWARDLSLGIKGALAVIAVILLVGVAPNLAHAADAAYPLRRVAVAGGGGPGGPRGFLYYVSSKADRHGYNFVVYALHDNGETAEQFADRSGWSKLAEDNGFVVVYPEANNKTWSPFANLEDSYLEAVFDGVRGNITFATPDEAAPPRDGGGGGGGRGGPPGGPPGGGPRLPRVMTWGAFHYITGDGAGARVAEGFAIANPGLFAAVATLNGTAYRLSLAKGDELAQGYFQNQRGGKTAVPQWRALKKDVALPAWLFTTGAPDANQTALANYWKRNNAVGAAPANRNIGGFQTAVYTNAAHPEQQVRTTVLPAGAKYDPAVAAAIWNDLFRRVARYTDAPNGDLVTMWTQAEFNQQFEVHKTQIGNLTYQYFVKTPSSYRKGTPMPLVLSAHGFSFPPWMYSRQIMMHEVGEKEGFITVYINGVNNAWDFGAADSPDFKYVNQVVAEMKANFSIDPTRVYMQGFSAGSGLTLAEGLMNPRTFAAVSPNSGIGDFTPGVQALITQAKAAGDVRIPMLAIYGAVDAASSTDALIPAKGVLANAINNVKTFNHITTPDKVAVYDSPSTAPYEVLTPGGAFTKLGVDAHYPQGRFFRYDYMSADPKPLPLFSWIWVNDMMHGGDYRQAQMVWNYFKQWRRNADGSLTYVAAR
jgi:poly(3-hydroxybutyrate) depolymerase